MSNLKNIPVFVTGASGVIGSELTKKLTELGADVSVGIRDLNKENLLDPKIKDKIKIFQLDILNPKHIKEIFHQIKPKKVFHLAGIISRTRKISDIKTVYETNVAGTINLIESLNAETCDCFLQFGTAGEYGDGTVPYSEESPLKPNTPYAYSKACATLQGILLADTFKLPIITARLFSVYGPQCSLSFVTDLIDAAQQQKTFKMTHGRQTRDFIYIDDVIEAIVKLSTEKEAIGHTFNICTSKETAIRDFALAFNDFLKNPIKIEFAGKEIPKNEILRNLGNSTKIRRLLDWEPSYDLKQGIQAMIHSLDL
jgi:nucleoside-diphosphate-sugar epimerase